MRAFIFSAMVFLFLMQISSAQTSIRNYNPNPPSASAGIGEFLNLINNLRNSNTDPETATETGERGLYMQTYPNIPEPNEVVRVSVKTGYINILDIDEIIWLVDGVRVVPKKRINEIEIMSKGVGEPVFVKVLIRDGEFGYITLEKTILPMLVDILWEGTGIVPSWYKGKPLPALQSPIKLTAIIDYVDINGRVYTTKDFVFAWRRGYFNAEPPTLGANTAILKGVDLRSNPAKIRLSVRPRDSNLELEKVVVVNEVRPTVFIYENNPIYGIIRERVVGKNSVIESSKNIVISAIPYFFEKDTAENIKFTWKINNLSLDIEGDTVELTNPNSESSSKQSAVVNLRVINTDATKFLQFDEYAISFRF